MARTERESESRRREEKWQTYWGCRDQQRTCRMAQGSAKKLEHTGPAKKKRVATVPQSEQLASTPEPSLPKKKEQRHLSRSPDSEVEESQGKRERIRAKAWGGKSGLHSEGRQIPRRRRRESKQSLLRELEGSMSG